MEKIAFITGGTSGIGRAVCERFAQQDFNLIITGRRNDRLLKVKKELTYRYKINIFVLNFDIQSKDQTLKALDSLPKEWQEIDILVNNAGLAAGLEKFQEATWDKWQQMIDTNITGLLFLTRQLVNHMIDRKKGHIVNISSIAGIDVYEGGSVYCASKHALNAISKGMRIDLLKHNIKVSSVSPGMVDTEFSLVRFDGDKAKADSVYKGLVPLSAEDVADAVEYIVTRPTHVNINELLIMPTQQASAHYTHRKH